jgi:hypothetical protein
MKWLARVCVLGCLLSSPAFGFDFAVEDSSLIKSEPRDLALGDVNGDGLVDAVLVYQDENDPGSQPGIVLVLLNTGAGFSGEPIFEFRDDSIIQLEQLGVSPERVELGDLNDDGLLDIVVASRESQRAPQTVVTWLINGGPNENGFTVSQAFRISLDVDLSDIAIAEATADRFNDVLVTSAESGVITVIRNQGLLGRSSEIEAPTVDEPTELPGLLDPTSIEPGDMDGVSDEPDEVIVASATSGRVVVYSRDDNDGFVPEEVVETPDGETVVLTGAADERSDVEGRASSPIDLFVVNLQRTVLSVIVNRSDNGNFAFDEPQTFDASLGERQLIDAALADVDGDGLADVVLVYEADEANAPSPLVVLRNRSEPGSLAFEPTSPVSTGNGASAVASGDIAGLECDEVVVARLPFGGESDAKLRTFGDTRCNEPLGPGCPQDFDNSGSIDINDLLGVLGSFASTASLYDLDGDGVVDIDDLLQVLGSFGNTCN